MIVRERFIVALEEKGPEVDIGNVNRWINGSDRHIAGKRQNADPELSQIRRASISASR